MSLNSFRGGRARAESGSLAQDSLAKTFLDISVRPARSRPLALTRCSGYSTGSCRAADGFCAGPGGVEGGDSGCCNPVAYWFWTPLAGGLIAVMKLGLALSHPADPWPFVHFGVFGAALAMLGPGGCSVDARLFGRKQIEIPQR